jgi:Thiamine monophosphate kinase
VHEIDVIRRMRQNFPVSPRQRNAPFSCDSELVELGAVLYGLSMDEFSPEEDQLPSDDPETLGGNLAVAVIADILAAGCIPEFYMHAVTAPAYDAGFCEALARGVQNVLAGGDCFLLGGDYGQSGHSWRYTGFAMGRTGERGALTRIIPAEPQLLWITGTVGDGNCHALRGTMPYFEPRFTEAQAIRRIATACMDTSGGLAEGLLTLSLCNPGHRFDVDVSSLPLDLAACAAANALGLPEAVFAFGGAGEYELLFTSPADEPIPGATRIGEVRKTGNDHSGVYWNGSRLEGLPDARSFADRKEYISKLLAMVGSCLS